MASTSSEQMLDGENHPVQTDDPKHEQYDNGKGCDEVTGSLVQQISDEEGQEQDYSSDEDLVYNESDARASDTDENATDEKQQDTSNVACKFYVRTQNCRYGKRCRFSHDVGTLQTDNTMEKKEVVNSPTSLGTKASTPCKFLVTTGHCRLRERCQYSHDAETKPRVDTAEMRDEVIHSSPPQVTSTDETVCKFYAKTGHCRFGERCRNSHVAEMMQGDDEAEMKNQVIVSSPRKVTATPAGMCKFYVKTGRCQFGNNCRNLHAAEGAPAVETTEKKSNKVSSPPRQLGAPVIPCKFYMRSGNCRFGDKCRYLHDADVLPAIVAKEIRNETTNCHPQEMKMKSKNSKSPQVTSASVCKFYAKTGRCHFGDRCRNLHIFELMPDMEKGLTACKFYIRTGNCHFGDQCRYSHEAEVMLADDDIEMTIEISNSPLNSPLPQDSRKTNSTAKKQVDHSPTSSQAMQGRHIVKACHFFKAGKCNNGDNCKFRHVLNTEISKDSGVQRELDSKMKSPERKSTPTRQQGEDNHAVKACHFFKIGKCTMGDNCKFSHLSSTAVGGGARNGHSSQNSSHKQSSQTVVGRQSLLSLDEMSVDDLEKLRKTEIQQLKKRYRSVEVSQEEPQCYKFSFVPTDPDWPYDVRALDLSVYFPPTYPKEVMQLVVPEQNIPQPVRQQVESCSTVWLDKKSHALKSLGKVDLMFRPFLRWLDRNLEDMFTKGLMQYQRELMAQAAGLQFVPAPPPQKQQVSGSLGDFTGKAPENTELAHNEMTSVESISAVGVTGNDSSDQAVTRDDTEAVNSMIDPARHGTEVKLQNLQLGENIATLAASKVDMIVQCERCHTVNEVSTIAATVNSVACLKCSQQQLVVFRPAIIHSFSSVLGYLDLEACVAFDLVLPECTFLLTCLNCSQQTKLQGLATGPPKELWCHSCHQKMTVTISSVRFTRLQSTKNIDTKRIHTIDVKLSRKVPRDPAIQPGSPLPDDGTCRHYKKSYRWLRFPCCGKAYPCDKCHDEMETDHEMKFANRMICGFCAKEQPFVMEGQCVDCQSSMTRRNTAHWEAGKGCRDKIKMSRGDARKFANSNKTISRKAEQKPDQKSKPKITKLRNV